MNIFDNLLSDRHALSPESIQVLIGVLEGMQEVDFLHTL